MSLTAAAAASAAVYPRCELLDFLSPCEQEYDAAREVLYGYADLMIVGCRYYRCGPPCVGAELPRSRYGLLLLLLLSIMVVVVWLFLVLLWL